MLKWFSKQEMSKRQARQQNKLKNLTDGRLFIQAIVNGVVFIAGWTTFGFILDRGDFSHDQAENIITVVILGITYAIFNYLTTRYRRNKLRNMEK